MTPPSPTLADTAAPIDIGALDAVIEDARESLKRARQGDGHWVFELEADAMGAEIAYLSGYDPVLGTGFFDRLPDPGDAFLGTHPPNPARKAQVAQVVANLRARGSGL